MKVCKALLPWGGGSTCYMHHCCLPLGVTPSHLPEILKGLGELGGRGVLGGRRARQMARESPGAS